MSSAHPPVSTMMMTPSAAARPRRTPSGFFLDAAGSGSDMGSLPVAIGAQAFADPVDASVAIEQVVGVERDDLPGWRQEVDARPLDPTEAEVVRVEEFDDRETEDVVVTETLRHGDLRQAAEESLQPLRCVALG